MPARVFMIPVVPDANPPCHSMVETLGFHSPHVDMSDQIFQTLSADAVVSTEVPYSAIIFSSWLLTISALSHHDERSGPKSTSSGQPGVTQVDAVAMHRDALVEQELALPSPLRHAAVGADDAMPWQVIVDSRKD